MLDGIVKEPEVLHGHLDEPGLSIQSDFGHAVGMAVARFGFTAAVGTLPVGSQS